MDFDGQIPDHTICQTLLHLFRLGIDQFVVVSQEAQEKFLASRVMHAFFYIKSFNDRQFFFLRLCCHILCLDDLILRQILF